MAKQTGNGLDFDNPHFTKTKNVMENMEDIEAKETTIEKLLNELMEMSGAIVELKASATKYQKEAEALRANEVKYKAILDQISSKVLLSDQNPAHKFGNGNCIQGSSRKPEGISGKTDHDLYLPEIGEKAASAEKGILEAGKAEDSSERYIHEGKKEWILNRKLPLKDKKGKSIGILGIEEIENKESHRRLKELFAGADGELQTIQEQLQRVITQHQQAKEIRQGGEHTWQRLAEENAFFAEIGRILREKPDPAEMYARWSAELGKLIPFDRLTITIPNLQENQLTLVYEGGAAIMDGPSGDFFSLNKTGEEEVIKTRSSLLLQEDSSQEIPGRFELFLECLRAGFQSAFLVPLWDKERLAGILTLLANRQNAYAREDQEFAEKVAPFLAKLLSEEQSGIKCRQWAEIGNGKKMGPEYARMVEYAPMGIWVCLAGTLKYANSKCTEILGYAPEELIAKPLGEFLYSEDRKMVLERHAGWLAGNTLPDVYTARFIHKEGHLKWLESKVALIPWEGKRAVMNYLTDVSERMWSQETMRSLIEQHHALLKCMEDILPNWEVGIHSAGNH